MCVCVCVLLSFIVFLDINLLYLLGNYYYLPGRRDALLCGNSSDAGYVSNIWSIILFDWLKYDAFVYMSIYKSAIGQLYALKIFLYLFGLTDNVRKVIIA